MYGVSGQTINAITGSPVSRVLIRFGQQALLTDYQGQFHFDPDVAGGSLSASKPGYTLSEDAGDPGAPVTQAELAAGPVLIRLYPEAILAGTALSPDGDPLAGMVVVASRIQYDEAGHHWVQAGTARTDTRGEFRLPLPAGDYRLRSMYATPSASRKEVILPVAVPENSSSTGSGFISLRHGETQRADLRPQVLPVTPITIRVEPTLEAGRGNIRLTAVGANGTSFMLRHTSTGTPGEMRVDLPRGSYLLEGTRQNEDVLEQGETRVTADSAEVTGVLLRLAAVNRIQIEIAGEAGSTSDNKLPTAAQLGLSLEDATLETDTDERLLRVNHRDEGAAYFNAPPGVYRLHAQSGGEWYIVSATYGSADLLRQTLAVASGVGSAAMRIAVSNQGTSLTGTAKSEGRPSAAWVYLIASSPSATPLVILHAGADGRYTRTALPPGTYRALAFEHRPAINFADPARLADFSNGWRAVTLNRGDKGTLDLEVTPSPEPGK